MKFFSTNNRRLWVLRECERLGLLGPDGTVAVRLQRADVSKRMVEKGTRSFRIERCADEVVLVKVDKMPTAQELKEEAERNAAGRKTTRDLRKKTQMKTRRAKRRSARWTSSAKTSGNFVFDENVLLGGSTSIARESAHHGFFLSPNPAMHTYFTSRYSSSPCLPPSRPIPLSRIPPKGADAVEIIPVLAPTMPYCSASLTLHSVALSLVNT